MFEVGFSEMVLIALVALLVLGPNKLPKLARDVGRWVGRARQMVRQMQDQLDHEARVAEWSLADENRTQTLRHAPPVELGAATGTDAPDVVPPSPPSPPSPASDGAAAAPAPNPHDRPLH